MGIDKTDLVASFKELTGVGDTDSHRDSHSDKCADVVQGTLNPDWRTQQSHWGLQTCLDVL